MARIATAHLLIGRTFGTAAHVPRFHAEHPRLPFEHILHAPETAAREVGRLFRTPCLGRIPPIERERERVDAVARLLRGETLPCKYMSQMTAAAGADDLRATPVGIGLPLDRTGNLIVEARPSTARIKLVIGTVEWLSALPAAIGPRLLVVVIGSRKGCFGSLFEDDSFLFGCQRLHGVLSF